MFIFTIPELRNNYFRIRRIFTLGQCYFIKSFKSISVKIFERFVIIKTVQKHSSLISTITNIWSKHPSDSSRHCYQGRNMCCYCSIFLVFPINKSFKHENGVIFVFSIPKLYRNNYFRVKSIFIVGQCYLKKKKKNVQKYLHEDFEIVSKDLS